MKTTPEHDDEPTAIYQRGEPSPVSMLATSPWPGLSARQAEFVRAARSGWERGAMSIREVLGHALHHLERYGWHRGENGRAYGPCCSSDAISIVCTDDDEADMAVCHLAKTIAPNALLDAGSTVIAWNDNPGMTFEHVRAAFLAAIETAP